MILNGWRHHFLDSDRSEGGAYLLHPVTTAYIQYLGRVRGTHDNAPGEDCALASDPTGVYRYVKGTTRSRVTMVIKTVGDRGKTPSGTPPG